jgi:hypothetical protein
MGKLIDLTGQTFGDLLVLERGEGRIQNNCAFWITECICGVISTKRSDYLRNGLTRNCGIRATHPHSAPGTRQRSYTGVHNILHRTLGKASDRLCWCGDRAANWAFLGCDDMVYGPGGTGPYCPDACIDEYDALCLIHARASDRVVRDHVERLEFQRVLQRTLRRLLGRDKHTITLAA